MCHIARPITLFRLPYLKRELIHGKGRGYCRDLLLVPNVDY